MHKRALQILIASAVMAITASSSQTTQRSPIKDPDLSKALRKYDLLKLNPEATVSQVRKTGKLELRTSKRVFDLQLVPHDLRSTDYRSQVIGSNGVARALPDTPVNTYKGVVRGISDAQVRMTITDNSIEGAIITNSSRYFIQPARSISKIARNDEFIFYDAQNLNEDAGSCGVTLADQVAAEEARAKGSIKDGVNSENISAPTSLKIVRLATEADAEYVAALGGPSAANNHIINIMNQVDGIYQVELGLTFQIVFQNTWTNTASDPYTSTDYIALLNEFATYWNNNFRSTTRSLAHLFTGKEVSGANGAAYLGTVCRIDSAYGFSRLHPTTPGNPITATTIVLTAHEIGHSFSAWHYDQPTTQVPPDIGPSCRGTIMGSGLGNGSTFCPFSRSQIMGFANGAGSSCLSTSSTSPPAQPPCVETPIELGVAISGSLAPSDCRSPSRGVPYFADRYSFQGQAGQRLNITMINSVPELTPHAVLIGPDGYVIAQDSFGNITSARIPPTGSFTLPETGKYIIEATSFAPGETGSYTIQVTLDGCHLSVNRTSQHFASSGGNGTISVTATGSNCSPIYQFTVFPNQLSWLTTQNAQGSDSQTLGFNVKPNANVAGRTAFLVVGAAWGTQQGGLSIPITQSGSGPDCSITPIQFGQTINGTLSTSDCRSPTRGGDFDFADRFVFTAAAGQEVAMLASPAIGNAFLTLVGPSGRIILTDIDGGGPPKARIPGGTGMLKLNVAGQYVIEVSSSAGGATGPYSLTLSTNAAPMLFAEQNSDSGIALDSVTLLRDPFPLTTTFNFSADRQTRVSLFAANLSLLPGENQSAVTAVAEDNQLNSYSLTVEFVGAVPGFDWLTQIVVKLPSNLPLGQEVRVTVTLRGQTSNKVRFRIKS